MMPHPCVCTDWASRKCLIETVGEVASVRSDGTGRPDSRRGGPHSTTTPPLSTFPLLEVTEQLGEAVSKKPYVVVVGTGTATGVPDQCVLHVGLNAIANTPAEALDLCAEAADRVISSLGQAGVQQSDVRTTDLCIQDFFDKATQQVTARIGSYQLEITVRSLGDVGRVVATLTAAAGDAFQILALHLVVSDVAPLQQEARRLAVLNAQLKASELAEAANVRLGAILSIQDEGGRTRAPYLAREMSLAGSGHVAASLPVEAGEVTTSSSVRITCAIDK